MWTSLDSLPMPMDFWNFDTPIRSSKLNPSNFPRVRISSFSLSCPTSFLLWKTDSDELRPRDRRIKNCVWCRKGFGWRITNENKRGKDSTSVTKRNEEERRTIERNKERKTRKKSVECNPMTDRYSDLAMVDDWNLLANFSVVDQADCQLQNWATWISRYLGTVSMLGRLSTPW